MSGGYSREFKDRAVQLFTDSRANYTSETEALHGVAKNLNVAPESLRRWREQADGKTVASPEESGELKQLRKENAELRRANEILQTASASSLHGSTRQNDDGAVRGCVQESFGG